MKWLSGQMCSYFMRCCVVCGQLELTWLASLWFCPAIELDYSEHQTHLNNFVDRAWAHKLNKGKSQVKYIELWQRLFSLRIPPTFCHFISWICPVYLNPVCSLRKTCCNMQYLYDFCICTAVLIWMHELVKADRSTPN